MNDFKHYVLVFSVKLPSMESSLSRGYSKIHWQVEDTDVLSRWRIFEILGLTSKSQVRQLLEERGY